MEIIENIVFYGTAHLPDCDSIVPQEMMSRDPSLSCREHTQIMSLLSVVCHFMIDKATNVMPHCWGGLVSSSTHLHCLPFE